MPLSDWTPEELAQFAEREERRRQIDRGRYSDYQARKRLAVIYKLGGKCVECGEADPHVLQVDEHDKSLVVEPTVQIQDGWAAGQASPLLLVPAGGESPDSTPVRVDAPVDQGAAPAERLTALAVTAHTSGRREEKTRGRRGVRGGRRSQVACGTFRPKRGPGHQPPAPRKLNTKMFKPTRTGLGYIGADRDG